MSVPLAHEDPERLRMQWELEELRLELEREQAASSQIRARARPLSSPGHAGRAEEPDWRGPPWSGPACLGVAPAAEGTAALKQAELAALRAELGREEAAASEVRAILATQSAGRFPGGLGPSAAWPGAAPALAPAAVKLGACPPASAPLPLQAPPGTLPLATMHPVWAPAASAPAAVAHAVHVPEPSREELARLELAQHRAELQREEVAIAEVQQQRRRERHEAGPRGTSDAPDPLRRMPVGQIRELYLKGQLEGFDILRPELVFFKEDMPLPKGGGAPAVGTSIFDKLDVNHDGVISKEELQALDKDHDGVISRAEFEGAVGKSDYLVDNSRLGTVRGGLAYRHSKNLDDKNYSAGEDGGPPWGSIVAGVDEGDGWLNLGPECFLPIEVNGIRVLTRVDTSAQAREQEAGEHDAPGAAAREDDPERSRLRAELEELYAEFHRRMGTAASCAAGAQDAPVVEELPFGGGEQRVGAHELQDFREGELDFRPPPSMPPGPLNVRL